MCFRCESDLEVDLGTPPVVQSGRFGLSVARIYELAARVRSGNTTFDSKQMTDMYAVTWAGLASRRFWHIEDITDGRSGPPL